MHIVQYTLPKYKSLLKQALTTSKIIYFFKITEYMYMMYMQ